MRHPLRGNKALGLITDDYQGRRCGGRLCQFSAWASKFFLVYGMAFALKKGCTMKFESFNRIAAEKNAVLGRSDSYVVRPQRRRRYEQ